MKEYIPYPIRVLIGLTIAALVIYFCWLVRP